MATTPDPREQLAEILMPYANQKGNTIRTEQRRFVQYTSAGAAVSILKNRRVWMRNASCMNDHSEMRYGLERVLEAYASPPGQRFQQALESIHPGITGELKGRFDPLAPSLLSQTYVACFSEHDDAEDDHGRLSMWRAYGRQTGVAIVMNNHPFIAPSDALNAWTTPVAYIRDFEFINQIDAVAASLEVNSTWLNIIPRADFLDAVMLMLVFAAVSIKHIGFKRSANGGWFTFQPVCVRAAGGGSRYH